MSTLADLFVGKPFNILLVAVALAAGQLAWSWSGRHSRGLLLAGACWAAYAAWEWLVQARTPDANIRVDLLVIWPVLALATAWGAYRALKTAAKKHPSGGSV